jgi:hypothetical protein
VSDLLVVRPNLATIRNARGRIPQGGTLAAMRAEFLRRGYPAADLEQFRMMAGFINSLEVAILDHVLLDATYTPPTNWFLGFSTTTPTETGSNFTEPSGNNYGRLSTAAADWANAVAGDPSVKDNATTLTMPTASGSWGTLTHFGLNPASSVDTFRIWGALDVSKAVASGDTVSFAVGALDVKLGDPADSY